MSEITALLSVIAIDLILAGDNAVVVGMVAAGLPAEQRRKAVFIGIAAAAALRILFAIFATQLLQIVGLLLAGGILLVWVCWKLWREIRAETLRRRTAEGVNAELPAEGSNEPKTLRQAVLQIIIADISMSLDNVLAVAGAAREHMEVMVVGLTLSVILMGIAATVVARLLHRYHWIAYVGLAVIIYVALRMIYEGGEEVMHLVGG